MTKTLTIVIKQELGIIKIVTVIMVTLRRNTTAKKKKKQKKGPENEQTNLARLRIWSGKVAQVNETKILNENVKSTTERKNGTNNTFQGPLSQEQIAGKY